MKSGFYIFLIILLPAITYGQVSRNFVQLKGSFIEVGEQPYTIKGICYHPVPKGKTKRSFINLEQDLELMQEAGINTIRIYEPIDDRNILDKINEAGIKLIVGFGYNQGGVFDILSGSVLDYVKKYKHHPAILIWELGNEYNYHPEWFNNDINIWYSALNKTATEIKKIDTNHLVGTAHGELPSQEILDKNNAIDIWGINVYRWDKPQSFINEWKELTDKAFYFSEAGADSYMTIEKEGFSKGNNPKAQAVATREILQQIFNEIEDHNGVTLFSFTDGWWKAGNPSQQDVGGWAPNSSGVPYDGAPNEEYWGIVDIERHKKEAFEVVKEIYHSNK